MSGARYEHALERLQPAHLGRTQQKLTLDEAGDLVDFPVIDGAVGCGDVDTQLEHQGCGKVARVIVRPPGFFLEAPAQERDPVFPGIGPAGEARVGLDHAADELRGLRQNLTLKAGESGTLGKALQRGQGGDVDERAAILARVFEDDLIPLFLVGMFDRGLQLVG